MAIRRVFPVSLKTAVISGLCLAVLIGAGLVFAQSSDDVQNQSDNVKGKRNYIESVTREINEIKREIEKGAKTTLDVSSAIALVAAYGTCVNELEPMVGGDNQVFWDKNRDCDDLQKPIEDHLNDVLRPQRTCQNYRGNVENRRRELKDMTRQLKDAKRGASGVDMSSYETELANLEALLAKLEQTVAACTLDATSAAQDIQYDIDDGFTNWYDGFNEIRQKADESRRVTEFQRNLKDLTRNCEKDITRELKNKEKQLQKAAAIPGAKEAYDKLKGIYDGMCGATGLLGQINQALQSNDVDTAESLRNDFWDKNRDFWDTNNEANEVFNQLNQMKDIERVLKEKKRQCKDKDHEYKRAVRDGRNTTALDEIYKLVACDGQLLKDMEAKVQAGDVQGFWDANSTYDENDRNFWDAMNETQFMGDFKRRLKDLERECNDRSKEAKRIEKEVAGNGSSVDMSGLKKIVGTCFSLLDEAKKAAEAKDFETLKEIVEDRMQTEVREQWDETTQSFFALKELGFLKNQLSNIERDIANGEKEIKRFLQRKQITQERADVCFGFVTAAKELLAQVRAAVDKGDIEGARELMGTFEELGYKAETQCIIFAHAEPVNVGAVVQQNFGDFEEQVAKQVMERVLQKVSADLVEQVVGNLVTTVSNSVLENLLSKLQTQSEQLQNQVAGLLENSIYLGDKADDLIQTKAEIIDLGEQMRRRVSTPGGEVLKDFVTEVEASMPVGQVAEELKRLTVNFLSNTEKVSGAALKQAALEYMTQAEAVLGRANEEAYREGYIPCKDTAVDQWYTKYAAELMHAGVIEGRLDASGRPTGECAPGQSVKITEVLKMVYGLMNIEASGKPAKVACAPWAAGYCAEAEAKGLFIVDAYRDLNRDATRAEVVRIILASFGVEPVVPEKASFADVKTSHPHYAFIETAKTMKLATGDKGKGTFRPDDPVKRGEIFRIMKNSMMLWKSVSESEEF